jgi:hypothetical protein
MNANQTVVTQLALSPAMHAAVLDSMGVDPAAFDTGGSPDRRGFVQTGLAELEQAWLLVRDGDVMIINPLVQEIVLTTLDPKVLVRCAQRYQGETPRTTSVFGRDLGPVAYAAPHPETGIRNYRIYDSWDKAFQSVVAWFELPEVEAGGSESTIPTEQAAAWLSAPPGGAPPDQLAELGVGNTRSVGNVAVVSVAAGVAEDGRNVAIVAAPDQCWFLEPDDSDPDVSSVRAGNAESLYNWLERALAVE